jgi:2-oxoisovalerate dehydrogenase E1 component
MPKSIEINPQEFLARNRIEFSPIEINAYTKTIEEEIAVFGARGFKDIYHDLCAIREFENILNEVKLNGRYRDLAYVHAGPAHLSIGQEAAAVGMAYSLTAQDHIFGSHRSHGEFLAKGLSAIRKLSEPQLAQIMQSWCEGDVLKRAADGHHGSIRDLAVTFLIYGAFSEIFARTTGLNRGMGGSMHIFFPPFGIYPNNAIVGGSGSLAPGAALFKRINRQGGIVVANIGDASFGCGPVWEGITMASMDQYRMLWDESVKGGLPILFNCLTNHYGMGGQPYGETMGCRFVARIGAGVNPEQMHAERVNGYDPLAVIDAIDRKKAILAAGGGPALLDTVTYRYSGHSPSDASSYRSKDELRRWQAVDAIQTFRNKIITHGIIPENELNQVKTEVETVMFEMFRRAVDLQISPRLNPDSEWIGSVMFSNRRIEKFDDREPELSQSPAQNRRVQQIQAKKRIGKENGQPLPKVSVVNIRDALFEAIVHRFCIDPTLVAFGEENRDWGGAFGVYRGLTELLPYHRLFNTPISEAGIVGAAVGYALEGGRVIAELMYADFMGRAGDEIFNQLSKWQAMSGGELRLPVVLRISVGSKYGAQHSQDWSALVHHIPGLKVVYPVTPFDAKGMMNAALAGTDPVVFFESQKLYDIGELFEPEGVPAGYYEIDLSLPSVKKPGKDITLMTFGPTLYKAIEVSDELARRFGLDAEVIDLRTANPLNYDPLVQSVQKTGKVVLACDAVERGSLMHTVASHLTQLAFDDLDAPPVVIGSRNWITPAAELENLFFPQTSWFLDAIHEQLIPLPGYQARTHCALDDFMKQAKHGV